MGVEHCVYILDSSNSFLRSYTPVPSAIFLIMTVSVCLELFPHWFLCYSLVSIKSYFIKFHWKIKGNKHIRSNTGTSMISVKYSLLFFSWHNPEWETSPFKEKYHFNLKRLRYSYIFFKCNSIEYLQISMEKAMATHSSIFV